jgi:hypothetical protein
MIDLIVMRLVEMHRVHPKQDSSRVCATCGERVGIYPSGQDVLRRFPTARIICSHCVEPVDVAVLAPGAEDEPFESVPARGGKATR